MSEFKVQTDETGLDLEHMKLALKTLAKLHAMSFAYFNNANVDIKGVSYLERSSYHNGPETQINCNIHDVISIN